MKDLNLIEEYNYDLFLVNTYEEVVDLIKDKDFFQDYFK